MTTTTAAVEDAREYVDADIAWLRKAPKAWSKVAADILAFGEAIESRDLVKYAKTLTAFAACMGPLLAALLAWKAAPSLELGIAAKVAAYPIFAAATKIEKPEDWPSQWDEDLLFGSKRLARLQKAVEALETMGQASSLAVCLEDEDNTPETWSEAGPDIDYIAAAATYEPEPVEDDEESEEDDEAAA